MSKLKLEKELFSYIQKQFNKNDFIKLDSSIVPKNSSNKLNRFYNDENPIWFTRLKISENEKYYYFGLKDSENKKSSELSPKIILRFNSDTKFSSIRFIKDQLAIIIKIDKNSDMYSNLNKKFSLKTTEKNKKIGIYFLILGKLNTKQILKNISTLVLNFDCDLKIKSNFLKINKYLEIDSETESMFNEKATIDVHHQATFENLKFNFKVIEFKNNLKNKNIDLFDEKKINEYLFSRDEHGNYCFDEKFLKKFSRRKSDLFDLINSSVLNLSPDSNFDDFLENME